LAATVAHVNGSQRRRGRIESNDQMERGEMVIRGNGIKKNSFLGL
jgi:hypothetical protein